MKELEKGKEVFNSNHIVHNDREILAYITCFCFDSSHKCCSSACRISRLLVGIVSL